MTALVGLLQEFHRDKAALLARHIAGAERVSDYNFNNTYQYIVNREEAQLAWVRGAIEEAGAAVPSDDDPIPVPAGDKRTRQRAVFEDDLRHVQAFLDKWTPRVAEVTHARHRKMLEVILGETVEHRRFFEQMLDGREDLLGRRSEGIGTGGGVLPVRWLSQ